MNNEYITKAQAIDLAESMRNLMAKGVADAFIKGIEGLEGCRLIKHREPVDGKTIAIKLSPEIEKKLHILPEKVRTETKLKWNPDIGQNIKHIHFAIDRTWGADDIAAVLIGILPHVFELTEEEKTRPLI